MVNDKEQSKAKSQKPKAKNLMQHLYLPFATGFGLSTVFH
jgi:hypothetical protein